MKEKNPLAFIAIRWTKLRAGARALWARVRRTSEPERATAPAPPVDPDAEGRALLRQMEREYEETEVRIAGLEQSLAENLAKLRALDQGDAVRAALEGFTFVAPAARRIAFEKINTLVQWSEAETLIGHNGEPLVEVVRAFLATHDFLLLKPEIQNPLPAFLAITKQ